jgi:hypothetical protein
MVATARERALSDVLRTMISGIAECPNVVLARIWLIAPSDRHKVWNVSDDRPDQTRCLHWVASAGTPRDPRADYYRLDCSFHWFAIGERKIGRVAETGEPLLIVGIRGNEEWIADREWIQREGIRTLAAQPPVFRDDVQGV